MGSTPAQGVSRGSVPQRQRNQQTILNNKNKDCVDIDISTSGTEPRALTSFPALLPAVPTLKVTKSCDRCQSLLLFHLIQISYYLGLNYFSHSINAKADE